MKVFTTLRKKMSNNMIIKTQAKVSSPGAATRRSSPQQDMIVNDELESMLVLSQTFSFCDGEDSDKSAASNAVGRTRLSIKQGQK